MDRSCENISPHPLSWPALRRLSGRFGRWYFRIKRGARLLGVPSFGPRAALAACAALAAGAFLLTLMPGTKRLPPDEGGAWLEKRLQRPNFTLPEAFEPIPCPELWTATVGGVTDTKLDVLKKTRPAGPPALRIITTVFPHQRLLLEPIFMQWKRAVARAPVRVELTVVEVGRLAPDPLLGRVLASLDFVDHLFLAYDFDAGSLSRLAVMNAAFRLRATSDWYLFHDLELVVNADFFEQIEKWRRFHKFQWSVPFKAVCHIDPTTSASILKWLAVSPSLPSMATATCLPKMEGTHSSLLVSHEAFEAVGGFDAEFLMVGGPGSGPMVMKLQHRFPLEEPLIDFVEVFQLYAAESAEWLHVVFLRGQSALSSVLVLPADARTHFLQDWLSRADHADSADLCAKPLHPGGAVHPKMSGLTHCLQPKDKLRQACLDDPQVRNWCILCEDEQWDQRSRYLRHASCPSIPLVMPTRQPDVVIGILSAPQNFKLRDAVRATWLRLADDQRVGFYFILGRSDDPTVNDAVAKEARTFGDIFLCLDLAESYRGISAKVLSFVDWVVDTAHRLPVDQRFKYLMKCDDDSFVRLDRLLELLDANVGKDAKRFYWGWDHGPYIPLRSDPKWAVSEEEFPSADIPGPHFAGGPGYVLSRDVAQFVANRYNRFPAYKEFPLEDVGTGIVIGPSGVQVQHSTRVFCGGSYYSAPANFIVTHDISVDEHHRLYEEALHQKAAVAS